MALFLRLLKTGGRAAVIVPDGVLFGSSKAHKDCVRMLVKHHKLDAGVISMPSGVFKPLCGGLDRDPVLYQDRRRRHRFCLVL
jgi:type I restriction enzyme M protein